MALRWRLLHGYPQHLPGEVRPTTRNAFCSFFINRLTRIKLGATTTKMHQKIFRAQVQRRKKEFAECEATFRSLKPSSRASILQSKKIFEKAKRLIDSGLSWLDRRFPGRFVEVDELFEDERKRMC
jgi:hypothetical protein